MSLFNEYDWYIPDMLKPIKDYKALGAAVDHETEAFGQEEMLVYNNSYLITADEDTLARMEASVGIVYTEPPSNEVRRANLFIMFGKTTPFTWRRFVGLLEKILVEDSDAPGAPVSSDIYYAEKDFSNFRVILKTRSNIVSQFQKEFVKKFVESVIPANMLVDYEELRNTWNQVSKYKWEEAAQFTWTRFSEDHTVIH